MWITADRKPSNLSLRKQTCICVCFFCVFWIETIGNQRSANKNIIICPLLKGATLKLVRLYDKCTRVWFPLPHTSCRTANTMSLIVINGMDGRNSCKSVELAQKLTRSACAALHYVACHILIYIYVAMWNTTSLQLTYVCKDTMAST